MNLLNTRGYPLDKQLSSWKELVKMPVSKLDDDAFTKVRIILMNGIELEALRFSHSFARMNGELQLPLAQVRRVEQQQATTINWLLGSDMSPLETTIAYEQVAIEITAAVAQREPDSYLAQVYRYGLLEDFDHMYRYSALMDRVEGKDANNILQSYTDIIPGRPTTAHHRAPEDELRVPYERASASPLTKFHALTIMAGEQQTHNYYMNIGPTFSDPTARQLYAEIASVEEQHVTQYESIIDPNETWCEKWVMHEANEVYNYASCAKAEKNARIRAIWERFLDYELEHLRIAVHHYKEIESRDPAEILPDSLPDLLEYRSQRKFVRNVLETEVDLRALGTEFVAKENESEATLKYRAVVNQFGNPSETVSAGYIWTPGTELARKIA
jgi:rubrerythrin